MADECILFPGSGGGIDQDTSEYSPLEEFSKGSYRYALNLRIGNTSKNQTDAGENLPSTLQVSNYYTWNGSSWTSGSAPSGTNTALNRYEDRANGIVYWAVYNSSNNHTILFFNKSQRKIYELLNWSGLNFALTNFVSMTKINKYLILTDGNPSNSTGNPPRCIDVTSIYILKNTLGSSFSEYHISFAKWAPVMPPYISKGSTASGNFLNKGIFQFAYRYIYSGGFKSTWSPPSAFVLSNPISALATPFLESAVQLVVNTPGFIFDYNNPSSTSFDNTDARFYDFVTYIEFGYRRSPIDPWKLFARNAVSSSSTSQSATFTNEGFLSAIGDIDQYFDSVPLLSRAVEAIDNRPMFGNNLDDLAPMSNFDVTNIQVFSVQPATNGASFNNTWYTGAVFGTQPQLFNLQTNILSLKRLSFKDGGIYRLGIIFQHYSGRTGLVQTLDKWTYSIPVTNDANVVAIEAWHALGFTIPNGIQPPVWATGYQIVRSNCLNIEFFITGIANDFKFLNVDTSNTDQSTATAQTIQDAVTGYYDSYNSGSGASYSLIARILSAIRKNTIVTTPASSTFSAIYIDIHTWMMEAKTSDTYFSATQTTNNSVFYNWQPGDRVKFWGSTNSDLSGGPYVQYDQEIITYTGTALIVAKPDNFVHLDTRANAIANSGQNRMFTIEVYRPLKTNAEIIFHETGEWYPIKQPGTVSRDFSKKDFQWIDLPSITYESVGTKDIFHNFPFIDGDVWSVVKDFLWDSVAGTNDLAKGFLNLNTSGTPVREYTMFPQMTPDKYDAAGTWNHNNGRDLVAYEYLPVQFEKSTQVRFGGKFLEDSIFIGINNFQDANQKIYPSEYGPIRAMVNTSNTQVKDVGQILMVICEDETMDVYVNRATLQSLGGQTQVTLSDQVLGSYNTLLGSYGTLNPESVSKRNSRVLFWNAKRGMWIRRSIDGLTPVSNYKMQNWFKDLSNLLIGTYATTTPALVLSVFDPYYEEWVTFINHSSLPSTYRGYSSYKSVSFDEDSKRWNTVYDYAPDLFASLENETYSIIGSVVHIHYAGSDYGSIYGVKKDCMWQPVANLEYRVTKVWKALNLQSTDKWSFSSIDGDFRSNGFLDQNSALLLTDLVNKEGTWWADIKRDLNTINASSSDQAIVNGDSMRSRALTLMLKLDPSVTWYSFVNWLIVTFDRSEKTVKK